MAFAEGKRDECVWQPTFLMAIYFQKAKLNINSSDFQSPKFEIKKKSSNFYTWFK